MGSQSEKLTTVSDEVLEAIIDAYESEVDAVTVPHVPAIAYAWAYEERGLRREAHKRATDLAASIWNLGVSLNRNLAAQFRAERPDNVVEIERERVRERLDGVAKL